MESVLSPGRTKKVDADKYGDMRKAMLASLPVGPPGITAAEFKKLILPRLSERLFPGGAKAGWWLKGAQLDLEAKALVGRSATSPLRFYAVE
jgi:hypothetical protein